MPARTPALEGSLRVRSLEARLRGRADCHELIRRAIELDARVQATFRRAIQPTAPPAARVEAVDELATLRREFDALLAGLDQADADGLKLADFGSALAQLEPIAREQLALVLGVPATPEFQPVLEVKAAEYLEQGKAFDAVSASFGFVEAISLGVGEARGALVLTQSASLLQLSAPGIGGDMFARRYVYDCLYGSALPSSGTLRLREPACIGARLCSDRMLTSVVRKLRLPVRAESWEAQNATFDRLRQTLRAALSAPNDTIWGAKPEWVPAVHMRSVDVERRAPAARQLDRAEAAARADLRDLVLRLADPHGPAHDPVLEASVIGLCIHLQELRVERGGAAYSLHALAAFETDRGERCVVLPAGIRLERTGRSPIEYAGAGIGVQRVTAGAPVTMIDAAGSILAVLGDVHWLTPR